MKPRLLIPVLFILLSISAHAATRHWTGNGADNRLSTPANWSQGVAPAADDDLVFSSFASQYYFLNDLPANLTLNSIVFQGGSYVCLGGGSKARSLTVNAGSTHLGPDRWTLLAQVRVENDSFLSVNAYGGSHFVFDGDGSANIWLRTLPGGSMIKRGAGTVTLDVNDSPGYLYLQQEAGRLIVRGDSSPRDNVVVVNGGRFEDRSNMYLLTATFRGAGAELAGHHLDVSGRLEISGGATMTLDHCFGVHTGNPVVLDGARLNPQFQNCDYAMNPIFFSSPTPVTGTFVNYPDGALINAGGRRYRVKYEGVMVNIRPVIGIPFDLDRDAMADISTFRPSDGTWYSQTSGGFRATQWGLATDKPAPGDYDGDERMDLAIYRPAEGTWYILRSIDGTVSVVPFGLADDIPVPRDFDGDGRTDPAVYRPSDGTWWANRSSSSIRSAQHGLPGDIPVPADYNGDGMADVAIFRPSTGLWSLCYAVTCHPASLRTFYFGSPGDKAVPADYDGDGTADLAVFRPLEGNWYRFLSSTQSPNIVNWGISTDQPVPADYDGDGRADVAIFRPSDGNWWINRSTAGVMVEQFGASGDRPVPGAFIQ